MQSGTRLGPYEILEQLGAGGMGEVWLAQDTRLGRKVAVKVLPEEFASDPERLARFEQEARAAAALNHPHIAAVYDIGSETGEGGATTRFMVQEYLQGHSLRSVLETRRMPLARALELGTEITEALAAAHRAGIVHRDLKPDNVFVTDDGHAKVLDFGLAKLTEAAGGAAGDQSMSPTILGTQAGTIMGTAGYMAPEQITGQEVDARADLFAFGCLLYEMASGKRAFAGQSLIQTLNRIAHEEPAPLASLDAALPAELQRIVRKCLAKSPARRYQTAADLTVDLLALGADVDAGRAEPAGVASAAPATTSRPTWLLGAVAAGALLAGAALVWAFIPGPPAPANGPVRFTIELPEGINGFDNTDQRVVAISHDGQRVVFVARNQLWLRDLGDLQPVALHGTDGDPRAPSFSPDDTQLAYWSNGQIKRVGLGGGAPVVVGVSPGRPQGVSWADDGYIYVGDATGDSLFRLPATGGQPETVVDLGTDESGEAGYGPRLLPGGEWLLFTLHQDRDWNAARIVAESLRTGERRVLVQGGRDARYVPTGHLLYVSGDVLLAARFEMNSLRTSGGAVPLIEGVRTAAGGASGAAYYSVAANGNLAYVPGGANTSNSLAWVDRSGQVTLLPFDPARFDTSVNLSPDGKRIAVEIAEGDSNQVWVYDVDRSSGQRLTTDGDNEEPVWSPDGQWVYFDSSRGGTPNLWRRRADLSSPEELVLDAPGEQIPTSISQDGRWLYFDSRGSADPFDIYRLDLREPGEPEPVVATPAAEFNGKVSPDGRFLAFVSNETGFPVLFVLELETGRRWRVSGADAVGDAVWSPAANEIVYRAGPGFFSVTFALDPEFKPDPPRLITAHPPGNEQTNAIIAPDGERFVSRLVDASDDGGARQRIEVILNWFAELEQRFPTER